MAEEAAAAAVAAAAAAAGAVVPAAPPAPPPIPFPDQPGSLTGWLLMETAKQSHDDVIQFVDRVADLNMPLSNWPGR